ncbi:DUF4349 domain-containing protein [Nonomuraea antimicrobica]|uniref:DUF4349 domain-containing protein n=1 Tax=Nonomuraea antimicrobica TaxID=561173 RepID=A0ABP7CHA5_9ACTN
MRTIRYGIALSAAVCVALVSAGCGGGGGGASAISAAQPPQATSERAPAVSTGDAIEQAGPEKQARSDEQGIVSDVAATRQERQVVYTGNMTVRAERVSTAAQRAKQIVTEAGGHLSQERTNSADATEDSATLEFKIPPDRYPGVLGRFGKELGKQLSMEQKTQDVTLQVADVESRLKSAQQSLESLRALLKRAGTIGQVLDVEREISKREADLESLQAQQKELATQTALATLTLWLVGPVTEVADPAEEPAGFLGGLRAGWDALVSLTKTALTVLGALVPWAVVSLPLVVLLVLLVRRDRAGRAGRAGSRQRPSGPGPEAV